MTVHFPTKSKERYPMEREKYLMEHGFPYRENEHGLHPSQEKKPNELSLYLTERKDLMECAFPLHREKELAKECGVPPQRERERKLHL